LEQWVKLTFNRIKGKIKQDQQLAWNNKIQLLSNFFIAKRQIKIWSIFTTMQFCLYWEQQNSFHVFTQCFAKFYHSLNAIELASEAGINIPPFGFWRIKSTSLIFLLLTFEGSRVLPSSFLLFLNTYLSLVSNILT
jgi:hypothetical protein